MSEQTSNGGFRVKAQRFGSFLSGMILPNIGAFIAWGLITALFIETGWLPNESLAELVGPMITYLLPILIGYTGGKMIHDVRGGVVGAAATIGVIVGADIPMFLGAMIVGPLGGFLIKKIDDALEGKIPSGFEMLINNFTAGILGAILAIASFVAIGPAVVVLNDVLAGGVRFIVDAGLLPFANIFVEPAKVLFLNNAINHGILGPIAIEEAARTGKSILFMLETNPGPGLGILLAFMLFGKGMAKQSASGAAIIHFLGGIHEIYFPYVLMRPLLFLAVIAGGISGVATFALFDVGLRATPSPGSIFAYFAMTPSTDYVGMIAGVLVATLVSFVVAAVILRVGKKGEDDLEAAAAKTQALKGKKSDSVSNLVKKEEENVVVGTNVQKVIFACDAGMGSSAMGASILRKKFKDAGLDISVTNKAINNIPDDADIVITHRDLTDRAKAKLPTAAHISVESFLNSPKYDELVEQLKEQK
ncbi:PTS mannitol transporter subunit IICB [Bacillus horti]|uniref:PTS system mannitol-specific EIICB component n=1 Tax=Caldalkalibacillus horti TaxID=77523 RepID=A0ABT9W3V7_9BACI|nr:PTS mannitol transporter subunit IICB [Bacillus horti]MDQ0167749.1 PTS system mannitol-specific IIC component [Bacillus horti]